jgi:hypothetical protein
MRRPGSDSGPQSTRQLMEVVVLRGAAALIFVGGTVQAIRIGIKTGDWAGLLPIEIIVVLLVIAILAIPMDGGE